MPKTGKILQPLRSIRDFVLLPSKAKSELLRDLSGLQRDDPGIESAVHRAIGWLCCAQDNSVSRDGGVARHFGYITGWGPSYPETTGYIIPTMLEYSKIKKDNDVRQRATRMLDWLVSIQFPDGGFQGGMANQKPVVPVTFNTGQILLGLAAGVIELGDTYRRPMRKAADWLVKTQDPDGCWRKFPTPFAKAGEKAYETHVAWGLFEAARIEPHSGYADAALANIRWALNMQHDNGWFEKCCLNDPTRPLTHTLGYALRGLIEAYRYSEDTDILHRCTKTADGLLGAIRMKDGFLPGRLYSDWTKAVSWACLTGSVQIAHCWLMLYEFTGKSQYRKAACAANQFVRRTVKLGGPIETKGGIKGSFPVNGKYGAFEYLNWACKFFIDSNMLEQKYENLNTRD